MDTLAAALIATACDRWPPAQRIYDTLTPEGKRAIMLIVLIILTIISTASQCAQNRPLCTRDTFFETALRVFGISLEILLTLIAINQSTHQLTKQTPAQK
jgi:hypothetical protein